MKNKYELEGGGVNFLCTRRGGGCDFFVQIKRVVFFFQSLTNFPYHPTSQVLHSHFLNYNNLSYKLFSLWLKYCLVFIKPPKYINKKIYEYTNEVKRKQTFHILHMAFPYHNRHCQYVSVFLRVSL